MEQRRSSSDLVTFLGGAVLGGVIGAGVALLFAPATGKETRERLKEKAKDLEKDLAELKDDMAPKIEKVKKDLEKKLKKAKKK